MAGSSHLDTVTIPTYLQWMQDNIFNDEDRVAMNMLIKDAVTKGGTNIVQPHQYAKNATAGSFNPRGTFPITNNQKDTNSTHYWATFAATVEYYDYDEAINSGDKARILNDIKNEFENAKMSLQDSIATSLVTGDRSTNAYGFDGLSKAMPAAANTYGDLDRSTYTWYDCQRGTFTGNALNLVELRTQWRKCKNGGDKPNAILTSDEVEGYYAAQLTDKQMLMSAVVNQASADDLAFMGVGIKTDSNVAATLLYFLNTKYSKTYKLAGWDMKMTDKIRVQNKAAWSQTILFGCSWYVSRPARWGVISGITS